jgi:hypothetical protein
MRNFSDKTGRQNQNTRFMFSNLFFGNRNVYEKMWKNIVERGRPQVQYGSCALHAGYRRLQLHSDCVTPITFPQQQWLHEVALMFIRTLPVFFFILLSWRLLATWQNCEMDWSYVVLNYFLSASPFRIKKYSLPSRAHFWRKFLRATNTVRMIMYI